MPEKDNLDKSETQTSSKRRVKNPETFRERAVKASEDGEKVGVVRLTFRYVVKIIGFFIKPLFKAIKWFFTRKPFLVIARIFRKPAKFLGRIFWPLYLRNSIKELRLVTWPNWKQSRQLTTAVIIFAVIFGIIVALVDYGLDKLFRNVLLK